MSIKVDDIEFIELPESKYSNTGKERRKARMERIKKTRKKQAIALTLVLTIIFILGILVGNGVASYNHKNNIELYNSYIREGEALCYSYYTVNFGDTVTSIAKKACEEYNIPVDYKLEMSYIIQMNNLTNADFIRAGSNIFFPYITTTK